MTVQVMVLKLIELGFSQRAIADRVGVSQPTIYRATKGAAVRYEAGKEIELFYEEQVNGAAQQRK
ncbi:helix-turn-helix domain-containing protein [Pseudomonas plecoglossicida]|uniref:helix-turn-helix domain-containing protein n=1 Tax=Pseudomonas plecoglossicida TaxID=70775 RepID=UPI0015E367BB|nr:helix-turn-helix domain-containing protein [Pseudomonas plecoglossicida]MBA1322937.1 hypothetical protein [Pseudomonas plecoglossicida]